MPITHPFAPLREPEHRFETPALREALARLAEGLGAREPFLLVTGAPGTGKTVLLAAAVASWGERAVVAFPSLAALAAGELVEEVVRRLGGEPAPGAGRSAMIAELERRLAGAAANGRVTVLAIDDAQELAAERLEELRALADAAARVRAPFEVVLAGTDALGALLERPERAALRQRVSVRVTLAPLTAAETKHYLHHRVAACGGDGPGTFGRRTCRAIAAASEGVPRRIDVIAHEALRAAHAAGEPTVTPDRVRAAAVALWGDAAAARLDAAVANERASAPARAASHEATAPAAPAHDDARTGAGEAPEPASAPATPVAIQAPASQVRRASPAPTREPAAPAPRDAAAAKPVAAAPRASAPAPPRPESAPAAAPQDPREWVARFVGDRGPIQIGSRAAFERTRFEPEWESEPAVVSATPAPAAPVKPASAAPRAAAPVPAPAMPASPRHRRRAPVLAGALAAVGIVAAIGFALRILGHAHAGAAPGVARTAAPAAPVAPAPAAPLVHVVPPAEASTPPVTRPAAASEGDAAKPRSDGRWAIDVGGYIDLDRALAERDRARSRTGIQAWVVPAPEGSAGVHRIVLGIFHSRERADAAAEVLLDAGSVREATVIPLPPRRDRR